MTSDLPKLLYIGDVPVEASYHGSALLYRLLGGYPVDRLRIIEGNLDQSLPERRLKNVPYGSLRVGRSRLLRTRFRSAVSSCLTLAATGNRRQVQGLCDDFTPEAILTVAHGYSWMAAAAFATKKGLPLHLIVHDDWPRMARLPAPMMRWLAGKFQTTYRQASTRLCVSPYMVEEYRSRYGVEGSLLYPSRAADVPQFDSPPERLAEQERPLVFAFGGTINTGGHVNALRKLAAALLPHGAILNLYGPISDDAAKSAGLNSSNIRLCGLVPSEQFVTRIRQEADVLFVPMSFAAKDVDNMSLLFPSKLTDYTAAGLPLLISGPSYSSAVRWAKDHPNVAVVLESESTEEVAVVVEKLLADPSLRVSLASNAIRVGQQLFSHAAIQKEFYDALRSKGSSGIGV